MRRHTIRTTKILAIAITAAGCASSGGPAPATSGVALTEEPLPVVAVEEATTRPIHHPPAPGEAAPSQPGPTWNAAAAAAQPAVPPPPAEKVAPPPPDEKLYTLRDDLKRNFETELAAKAKDPRYRPLCDAKGYPLVGNLLLKSGSARVTTLCSYVRENMK